MVDMFVKTVKDSCFAISIALYSRVLPGNATSWH
jgi:hypothetical protein